MLLGKTVGLLQLYLQPALQGYPSFNNFSALYNASSQLGMLLYQDILSMSPQQIANNIPQYFRAMGMFVNEFGNVDSHEIKILTGNNLSLIIKQQHYPVLYPLGRLKEATVSSHSNIF